MENKEKNINNKAGKKKTTKEKKKNNNDGVKKKEKNKKNETEKVVFEENIVTEEEVVIKEIKKDYKTENKKKIKISDIVLILGLVLVCILGFFLMKGEKPVLTYELPLTLSGEAGLHELTYDEYQEKIDNDESFVVILERATCSYCVTFMPIAESVAVDNGLPMYYLDTDKFSSEDWQSFDKSNSYLRKINGNLGTPTTVVLAGYEAVDYIEGAVSAEEVLALYNEYFDMSEE